MLGHAAVVPSSLHHAVIIVLGSGVSDAQMLPAPRSSGHWALAYGGTEGVPFCQTLKPLHLWSLGFGMTDGRGRHGLQDKYSRVANVIKKT